MLYTGSLRGGTGLLKNYLSIPVGTYVRRYIEAAFRLKFRLLIGAVIVFGVVSAALYLAKQGYGASATVWVEEPIYFADTGMTKNWNPYMTPADNQANILQELLRTRQFALNVANGAQIPMPNEVVENRVLDDLQKNMRIESQGTHLIKISYSAEKPTYCKVLVEQVIIGVLAMLRVERVVTEHIQAGLGNIILHHLIHILVMAP